MSGNISLYFHIPFCTKKCPYCHFYVIPNNSSFASLLLEGLLLEWESYLPLLQHYTLTSIYFGGGTPSLFPTEAFATILEKIQQTHNTDTCEITLEANPESIDQHKMTDLAALGFNRVSIGIQSLDPQLLSILGRTHTADDALTAINDTKNAGIDNITVDLMYDIPHQTLHTWQKTLHIITDQPITHLSLYNLTIEPHTLYFKQQNKLRPHLPSHEDSTEMYQLARSHFTRHGFEHYEISAFAKPSFASKHNSGYWTGRPFIGLGPSAFSYYNGKRFRNVAHLQRYHNALMNRESPIDFEETLSQDAHIKELLTINLRLLKGVDLGDLPKETMETIHHLIRDGLLKKEENRISLTEKGIMLYDSIAVELI